MDRNKRIIRTSILGIVANVFLASFKAVVGFLAGSVEKGLFTVRHIEDKWYLEVPDSVIGRYLLAVTRFRSVPQGFGKFSGEEVNEQTIYFEQRDDKNLLLRAYVIFSMTSVTPSVPPRLLSRISWFRHSFK